MLAFLGTIIAAMLAILPAMFVSTRRRSLRLVREEAEALELVKDDEANAQLREAHRETVEAYRARVLGLGRLDRARRVYYVVGWSSMAFFLTLGAAAIATNDREAHTALFMQTETFLRVATLIAVILLVVVAVSTVPVFLAISARRKNREEALDEYEKEQFVEDVRSGALSPDAYEAMIEGMKGSDGEGNYTALLKALRGAAEDARARWESAADAAQLAIAADAAGLGVSVDDAHEQASVRRSEYLDARERLEEAQGEVNRLENERLERALAADDDDDDGLAGRRS